MPLPYPLPPPEKRGPMSRKLSEELHELNVAMAMHATAVAANLSEPNEPNYDWHEDADALTKFREAGDKLKYHPRFNYGDLATGEMTSMTVVDARRKLDDVHEECEIELVPGGSPISATVLQRSLDRWHGINPFLTVVRDREGEYIFMCPHVMKDHDPFPIVE